MRVERAEFVRAAFREKDFIRDGRSEVAFVGRSNVGKSSVLNCLLGGRRLARTSSTPGRTRGVYYYLINDRFYFVDLPGYGYAKAGRKDRESWARAVDLYLRQAADRARVVLLVDSKVGATDLDAQAHDYLSHLGLEIIVVATKIDRISKNKRARALAEIRGTLDLEDGVEVLPFSARTREGGRELWNRITAERQTGSGDGRADGD